LAPYSYSWVFGDGGTSTGQNPSHIYQAAGSFSAILTVTDSLAHSASAPAITVTAYAPLVVSAAADITSGTAPLTVHFTGLATGGLAPCTYSWTFGDGGTSTDQNPDHEYSAAGAFSAVLTVTDSASHTASASPVPITVYSPLVASAAADTSSGTAPLTVHFAGSASGGLGPYTYAWTFGNGGTSAVQNPSHEYAAAGTYAVSLTVTDSASRNATDAHLAITVSAPIPPPVISLMKKASPPFKIVVTGSNLQDGVRLFINGIEWTNMQWKNTTKVKILGGASLKTAVPKGLATTFRFLNPDGGETTLTWSW
jgi:PKD repeat protein